MIVSGAYSHVSQEYPLNKKMRETFYTVKLKAKGDSSEFRYSKMV